jgi:hypothetical protein
MRLWLVVGLWMMVGLGPAVRAQTAQEMQSAAPAEKPGESEEQHGRRLLDEMLQALGGDAWLNKQNSVIRGQTAAFFRNVPTGRVVQFEQFKRFGTGTVGPATRTEYLSERGMIMPGKRRDVIHLWVDGQGYEATFKGVTPLPEKDVTQFNLRQQHSLEEVMRSWVKQPGVVIVWEGVGTQDRRAVDKVSVLTADNDNVEIEIEQDTHYPLQRSFQTRNAQFKDFDVDEEVYGDWRMVQGIATPMNVTNYKNADMVGQTFYTKVEFNQPLPPDEFNKDQLKAKK